VPCANARQAGGSSACGSCSLAAHGHKAARSARATLAGRRRRLLERRSWKDKEFDKWREATDVVGLIEFLAPKDDTANQPIAAGASDGADIPSTPRDQLDR
jgi:hypothetical protein